MKTLLTIIMITVSLIAKSQATYTILFWTDANPEEFTMTVTNDDTMDTVAVYSNLSPSALSGVTISLPVGTYSFHMDDSGGDGFTNGMVAMASQYGIVFGVLGNYGSYTANTIMVEEYDPCPYCRTDLDNDGMTGVSDLLIFIAAYGQTCD